jgi:hypothetical protein
LLSGDWEGEPRFRLSTSRRRGSRSKGNTPHGSPMRPSRASSNGEDNVQQSGLTVEVALQMALDTARGEAGQPVSVEASGVVRWDHRRPRLR